jgi:hypothetical protein
MQDVVTSFLAPNAAITGRQAPFPADPVHGMVRRFTIPQSLLSLQIPRSCFE